MSVYRLVIIGMAVFLMSGHYDVLAGGVSTEGLTLEIERVVDDFGNGETGSVYTKISCTKPGGYEWVTVECDFLGSDGRTVFQGMGHFTQGLAAGQSRVLRVGGNNGTGEPWNKARCYFSSTR